MWKRRVLIEVNCCCVWIIDGAALLPVAGAFCIRLRNRLSKLLMSTLSPPPPPRLRRRR